METLYQQLETVIMEDDEDTDVYSDPYENYCRLERTVRFLESGGRVTEEWMDEHRRHILKYHAMFPNYSEVNLEITDKDFRRTAQECEVLLGNLVNSIRANRFFPTKFYLMLNQRMIKLCQFIFTEDELEFCMSKLSI